MAALLQPEEHYFFQYKSKQCRNEKTSVTETLNLESGVPEQSSFVHRTSFRFLNLDSLLAKRTSLKYPIIDEFRISQFLDNMTLSGQGKLTYAGFELSPSHSIWFCISNTSLIKSAVRKVVSWGVVVMSQSGIS